MSWLEHAACKGLDLTLFFSDDQKDQSEAKLVCATCVVRQLCLEEALQVSSINDFGVRGGMTATARRRFRKGLKPRNHSTYVPVELEWNSKTQRYERKA